MIEDRVVSPIQFQSARSCRTARTALSRPRPKHRERGGRARALAAPNDRSGTDQIAGCHAGGFRPLCEGV